MITLNAQNLEDRAALHALLKDALDLPDYYGCNLDALNDCLGEKARRELIVIHGFSDLAENLGLYALKLLQVLSDNGWQVLLD